MTDNDIPFTDLERGRALLDAMRAEERDTEPNAPRPEYVRWLVWARENAEWMIDRIESLEDESNTSAHQYRELREPISRLVALTDWVTMRSPDEAHRDSFQEFGRGLRRALGEVPGLSVGPACPPHPLSPGVDYGRAGWKVAVVNPAGKVEVLHADLDTIDQVRDDGMVREWTITLRPPAKAVSDE